MRNFFRNNPTIAFGLGLPLLVLGVMLAISIIPALTVKPPQYDVVYAVGYHADLDMGIKIQVKDHKARVAYIGGASYIPPLEILRYSAKTGKVEKIAYKVPQEANNNGKTGSVARVLIPIAVPELQSLTLDTSLKAPDGYKFMGSEQVDRPNLSEFFINSDKSPLVLSKNGRSIRLKDAYYSEQVQFIGWVIP